MRWKNGFVTAGILGFAIAATYAIAQETPPARVPPGAGAQTRPATVENAPPRPGARRGGFVPGQKRAPEDPAQILRGKTVYDVSCRGCHGVDLRGGDMGGPNLLRSQVALSDREGELIIPIIHGSRQDGGMPAIQMSDSDAKAVAAYVRSVVATIGTQGMPPSIGLAPTTIVVGNANDGQKYFAQKCSGCHSASGDLQGIAGRIPDPKTLQNTWVAGRGRMRRGPAPVGPDPRTPTATITLASGEKVEGQLVLLDDFLVSVTLADGTPRTFPRDGGEPKVEVHDGLKAHRDILSVYTDKNMHDVTAYLVTLK